MTKKGKNHLIMVNTTAEKEVGVVLDYLAQKQCDVAIDKVVIRTQRGKISSLNRTDAW